MNKGITLQVNRIYKQKNPSLYFRNSSEIKKFVEKFIIMKLKDIVVFDENVLHRSNKNLTNKIRFAGTVRYQIIN